MSNKKREPPRNRVSEFAETSSDLFFLLFKNGLINIKTQKDFKRVVKVMKCTNYRGVNLTYLDEDGKNTIEFRMPNGTIEPQVVRENIKLFGSLLNISKEMSLNPDFKNREFETLKRRDLTEKEKTESLLNLLFDDEEEKSIYRERWDSVKDYKEFEMLKAINPSFKRGDYSMREQTAAMFTETKAEDRANFFQTVKNELAVIMDYGGR